MTQQSELEDPGYCPFLFPVAADRLWMRPIGVYCHRPGRAVRIPATSTLTRCCTAQYRLCDGYSEMWADSLTGDSSYWLSVR
jgi:hypothetical protein